MQVSSVSQSTYSFAFSSGSIDAEEKAIMDKLYEYGCIPTGDKQTDRATLRRIEEEKVRQEIGNNPNANISPFKYLTISPSMIEQIKFSKKILKDSSTSNKQTDVKQAEVSGAGILAEYNKFKIKQK